MLIRLSTAFIVLLGLTTIVSAGPLPRHGVKPDDTDKAPPILRHSVEPDDTQKMTPVSLSLG
ncbi:uncharacterized protein F5891DRAFT_1195760 [Suillus fuscotomentosus]|uniref:Uncharacterized protein n=1 Tax=Suillus fuscotomentosus TaxID=1912939 RepID=A0AAD4DU85_9AGAM|nr:uncharacterized protein F5891DRAFT_1195760 [Suillus fuscotomentosus]KAG1893956.1 hypothetical protein F5891DRAFT_1195760 [Suillus fuscotomentosus]